jgi:hypothetical protein
MGLIRRNIAAGSGQRRGSMIEVPNMSVSLNLHPLIQQV